MANTLTQTRTGKVVWFDDGKGYGFIRADDGPDFYVHFSEIQSPDKRRRLAPDQRVRFIPTEGKKGPAAVAVEVLP